MWMKRQLLNYRVKQVTRGSPVSMYEPDRVQTWELLELLQTDQFDNYKPVTGFQLELKMLYPNVDLFFNNLQDIAYKLKTGRHITPELVKIDRVTTNLENYLVTKDGFIMEISMAVATFKRHAQGICMAMDKEANETHAHYEHNLRMLTHVFADIQILTRALLSIAYRK